MTTMPIKLGFGGGAELLFNNQKSYSVSLPAKSEKWLIADLLLWIKDNLLKERPELFIQDNSVRPGILVLVNDVDWELVKPTEKPVSKILSTLQSVTASTTDPSHSSRRRSSTTATNQT